MQSTFGSGFKTSFKGKYGTAGFLALVENGGCRTVGGFISKDNAPGETNMTYVDGVEYPINTPLFGVPLFATPDKPFEFFAGNGGVAANVIAGTGATVIFRGFLLNRAMINQQFPSHSAQVLNLQPCDAVYQGGIWLQVQAPESGNVKVGDGIYVDAAGNIYAGKAGASSTTQLQIPNAKIIEKHQEVDGLWLVMLS